ncbi:MAG TPA: ribosomal protein S18-alanine N-acetyltransferase [Tissierellaceae bacterium]|nr:ribosomal protein S18-alanine N-acetyltransferase [Tissierellaceae bacterium]
MDIVIRAMDEEDIDEIVEIEKECFPTPWSRDAFLTEIRENNLAVYLVAELYGRVVGYGGMWLVLNEGHITNIAVKKDFRGLGIGDKILENLIYYCASKGVHNMTLEVRKSNIIAQNLYKKYKFVEYGLRPRYYSDNNEDALIMWRTNKLR